MQLDDVIGCVVRENKTNQPKVIDGVTLSPHSVYVCVLGGNDGAIATLCIALFRPDVIQTEQRPTRLRMIQPGIKEPIHFQRPTDAGYNDPA